MHIAYISHEYPPDTGTGGIGTYTIQMALAMSALGHTVEVFAASFHRVESNLENGVWVHRVLFKNVVSFSQDIVPIFKERHLLCAFDLIECPEIGAEARELVQIYPEIPLVVRLHTSSVLVVRLQNTYTPLLTKLRFVLGSILRFKLDWGFWSKHDKNQMNDPDFLITEKAAIITAPSEAMKNWAVKFWRINPNRINIVYNPYQPSEALLSIKTATDNKTITFLGRLTILKGLVSLSQVIPIVLRKHPDWKFRLIGSTEQSPVKDMNMKEWLQIKLAVNSSQIEWIDWIAYEEIPKYFANTSICVFPSLFESFSYVCVEAMSAGKAIVGSKSGGMKELLADDCGIVVDPKNVNEIAKALNNLIEDEKMRTFFGTNARLKVISELNTNKIGKQMEGEYQKILNKNDQ